MRPLPLLSLCALGLGCRPHWVNLTTAPPTPGPLVRVSFEVDGAASHFAPSVAIWAVSGDVRETLFASRKAAEGRYLGGQDRPENLPVWDGVVQGPVDAVTGATPRPGPGEILWRPPPAFQHAPFDVFVEVNASFDDNEAWPDEGGVNGQPSLIWRASLPALPAAAVTVDAVLLGYGAPTGADHALVEGDLDGISTARDLLTGLRVTYEP